MSDTTSVVPSVSRQQYAAYQVYTECLDERQVLWISAVKAEKVKRSSSHFAMYATNSNPVCDTSTEEQRAKLQKIKELTNILKDTDRNLTECEEILANYIRKRLRDRRDEMQKRSELENKMSEILENLKTRLLLE